MNQKDLKIVVIYGGVSSEREVSLRSGKAVFDALVRQGYRNTSLFDLTEHNLAELFTIPMDVAYLALHGWGGEDGRIQGVLDLMGVPYTGSSVEASAICMNKIRTKEILRFAGLPTPRFVTLRRADCKDLTVTKEELLRCVDLPMVVKSPSQGSSVGVYIIKKEEELLVAIQKIFALGDDLLAEEFVDGVELTLPILGNNELTVLPVIEITSENEFYDYEAKYTAGMCHHILPARISETARAKIEKIGSEAYRVLGCRGLARIDFILSRDDEPMIIEINTLPGMTEMSLFPDSARSVGISFEELTERIVFLAYEAYEQKGN
ncbi:MAG: D-alanine--D-alanine ligase [Clostridia bacterium]|nr:D-alanine--D-alanine ligase [Clostridia bacterium]